MWRVFSSCLWLLLLSVSVTAQHDQDLYKKCPAGHVPVQHAAKQLESNGCSKPAGISIAGEEDFTYCCDRHDVGYLTCNMNKAWAETEFKKCLSSLCRTTYKENPHCQQAADMYVFGTTMLGGGAFAESQNDYCSCVPSSDVKDHYTSYIQNFYKKHAHDKAAEWEDGSKLAKYLEPTAKPGPLTKQFAKITKLIYQLHSKYPKALKHVGARVGKEPPGPRADL